MSTTITAPVTAPVTASLATHKQHGISISEATHIQNNYWVIPTRHQHLLSSYFILSWDVDYFKERLQEGTIRRESITYQVIYHRTNPAEIAKGQGQVKLSFRAFNRGFSIQPTVLVSLSHKFHTANRSYHN